MAARRFVVKVFADFLTATLCSLSVELAGTTPGAFERLLLQISMQDANIADLFRVFLDEAVRAIPGLPKACEDLTINKHEFVYRAFRECGWVALAHAALFTATPSGVLAARHSLKLSSLFRTTLGLILDAMACSYANVPVDLYASSSVGREGRSWRKVFKPRKVTPRDLDNAVEPVVKKQAPAYLRPPLQTMVRAQGPTVIAEGIQKALLKAQK